MKAKFAALLALATLASAVHAKASTILPDACGSDKMRFDVDKQKGDGTVPPPSEGKARIIFIDTVIFTGFHIGGGGNTTRFGLDGTWMGATAENSYFSVEVAPGEHHICSSEQGVFSGKKDGIGLTKFTAEAGKVYYFEYKVEIKVLNKATLQISGLSALDEDEGKYRVKALKLSTFKPS